MQGNSTTETVLAWHFVGLRDGKPVLRDGRPLPPVGRWLTHKGKLALCESGLHASILAIDALKYAPGPIACRVECGGRTLRDLDKIVARKRRVIGATDTTEVLRVFARRCALDVLPMWSEPGAPDVVRRYLDTGDEALLGTAWEAARDAAKSAVRTASWEAARAARVAGSASWCPAWQAARSTASIASRAVAWEAASASAATWTVVGSEIRIATDAAMDKYGRWLEEMLSSVVPGEG